MSIKTTVITPKIIQVSCGSKTELGETFMRFQEHYENPEWRNRIFTRGQFEDWYSRTKGASTYSQDWAGFNIPSSVLDVFIKGLFDPLTANEQEFLNLFKYRTDRFYIIGAQEDAPGTLDHEICHALYYTEPKYKEAVNSLLKSNRKKLSGVYKLVEGMMYAEEVVDDEVQAYMSSDFSWLQKQGTTPPIKAHKELRKLKKRFYKEETE